MLYCLFFLFYLSVPFYQCYILCIEGGFTSQTQFKDMKSLISAASVGIFTSRNEVVAKVMFLHVSVILLTGGVSGEPPRDQGEPPQTRHTPPGPRRTPPGTKENPSGTRHSPPDQGEPPLDQGEPLRDQAPPPGKNTAAYGQ